MKSSSPTQKELQNIMRRRKYKNGQKYGTLTLIRLEYVKDGNRYWLAKCDCGKVVTRAINHIPRLKSCGHSCKYYYRPGQYKDKLRSIRNALIAVYSLRAEKRGYKWLLNYEVVKEIFSSSCAYCGMPPSNEYYINGNTKKTLVYSGIDRVDNNKGYTKSNVVACCKLCNAMKREMSTEKFISWAKKVASHRKIY